jgi:hypothetical protein
MRVLASIGMALLVAVFGYSYTRLRRRGFDVGTVSDTWLAERRAESHDLT